MTTEEELDLLQGERERLKQLLSLHSNDDYYHDAFYVLNDRINEIKSNGGTRSDYQTNIEGDIH